MKFGELAATAHYYGLMPAGAAQHLVAGGRLPDRKQRPGEYWPDPAPSDV